MKLHAMKVLLLAIVACVLLREIESTDYPAPPQVPVKFDSPQEVLKYLNQLHNYYLVVGRPR